MSVGVAVALAVAVVVAVGVRVAVSVGVLVCVEVAVAVLLAVAVGVLLGLGVAVAVGVGGISSATGSVSVAKFISTMVVDIHPCLPVPLTSTLSQSASSFLSRGANSVPSSS